MESLSKSRKKFVDYCRKQLIVESSKMDKHDYHFGIRFYSDKMVSNLLNDTDLSIMDCLKRLARRDYEEL